MAGRKKDDGAPTTESTCGACGEKWTGRMRWDPTYRRWRAYAWCIPCANEQSRRRKAGLPPIRNHPNCKHCGANITHLPARSRYCDPECRTAAYAPKQTVKNREGSLRVYGLTPAQWDAMVAAQDGKCALCRQVPRPRARERRPFDVDHDHSCCPGRSACQRCVRALLCHRCNMLLGLADDDAELLLAGVAYLREWAARREGDLGLPA